MSNSATNELLGVERRMLDALRISYDAWITGGGGVAPAPLVKLMTETHACIRERVKRQFGIDTSRMSLREQLVEIEQVKQQLIEMLELEDNEDNGSQVSQ